MHARLVGVHMERVSYWVGSYRYAQGVLRGAGCQVCTECMSCTRCGLAEVMHGGGGGGGGGGGVSRMLG